MGRFCWLSLVLRQQQILADSLALHTGCRHITSALWAGEAGNTAKGQRQCSGVRQTCRTGHSPYILVFPFFSCFPSFPSYFLPCLIWRSLSAESSSVVYSVNYKPKHFCPAKSPKDKQMSCPLLNRGGCYFGSQSSLHNVVLSAESHPAAWQLSLSALREWAEYKQCVIPICSGYAKLLYLMGWFATGFRYNKAVI